MKLSKHAKIRCGQRGIQEKYLGFILEHGEYTHRNGALEVVITNKIAEAEIQKRKRDIKQFERLRNKSMIVSDNSVLTIFHRSKKRKM